VGQAGQEVAQGQEVTALISRIYGLGRFSL
jgi:hypothetical protein